MYIAFTFLRLATAPLECLFPATCSVVRWGVAVGGVRSVSHGHTNWDRPPVSLPPQKENKVLIWMSKYQEYPVLS